MEACEQILRSALRAAGVFEHQVAPTAVLLLQHLRTSGMLAEVPFEYCMAETTAGEVVAVYDGGEFIRATRAEAEADLIDETDVVLRRRAAGPWEPAPAVEDH